MEVKENSATLAWGIQRFVTLFNGALQLSLPKIITRRSLEPATPYKKPIYPFQSHLVDSAPVSFL